MVYFLEVTSCLNLELKVFNLVFALSRYFGRAYGIYCTIPYTFGVLYYFFVAHNTVCTRGHIAITPGHVGAHIHTLYSIFCDRQLPVKSSTI